MASISSFSRPVIRNCLLFGFSSSVLPPISGQKKWSITFLILKPFSSKRFQDFFVWCPDFRGLLKNRPGLTKEVKKGREARTIHRAHSFGVSVSRIIESLNKS